MRNVSGLCKFHWSSVLICLKIKSNMSVMFWWVFLSSPWSRWCSRWCCLSSRRRTRGLWPRGHCICGAPVPTSRTISPSQRGPRTRRLQTQTDCETNAYKSSLLRICGEKHEVITEASEQRHKEESLHAGLRGLQVSRAECAGGSSAFYSKTSLTEKTQTPP